MYVGCRAECGKDLEMNLARRSRVGDGSLGWW